MTEAEEQPVDTEDEPEEGLLAEVAALDEELAGKVGDLLERVESLESELERREAELERRADELEATTEKLEHTRADFQNYKKRAKRRQDEIKERATEDLVERLLDVRDNLTRALEDESEDVSSLREGIKLTRKQFDRVLDAENVTRIEPEAGSDVDANRHEVMMRVESEEPADTIASVYRPGYEMAGKVLRPAQVTVSEGPDEEDEEAGETAAGSDTDEDTGEEAAEEHVDAQEEEEEEPSAAEGPASDETEES